jgi:hypothetical protein
MAAALGNLSPLFAASVAGGSVASHGIFLLATVPTTNAAVLRGGLGYSQGAQTNVSSRGLSNHATASPLSTTGILNDGATVNAALQEGGFGFTAIWPQGLLGSVGLKRLGTAWAAGSLGLFFDNQPLNGSTLPGSDPGLMPVSGTLCQAPYGVRNAATASAVGSYGCLFDGDSLTQAALPGYDSGLMPVSGTLFQGSHGFAAPTTSLSIINAGLSNLYGYVVVGVLPTYHSIDAGAAALSKTFITTDKAASANRLTFTAKDAAAANWRTNFYSVDKAVQNKYATFYGVDKSASAHYKTYTDADSGYATEGAIRYYCIDAGTALLRVAYKAGEFGTSALNATFASTDKSTASNRHTFSSAQWGVATYHAVFSAIWPAPFIGPAGLHISATGSAIGPYGVLNNTAHINLAGFRHGQDTGYAALKNTFNNEDSAASSRYQTVKGTDSGSNTQPARYHIADVGQTKGRYTRHARDIGVSRQPQASLIGFKLYLGIDAAPNLTATPWQTFTTKPFATPALATGHTYQLVLQQVNEFGLSSQNATAWIVTPSGAGVAPSAPTAITITPSAGGTVVITAAYDWRDDGVNAADSFLIYTRTDGSNPNPATDTPALVAIWTGGASAVLSWQSPAATEGATIKTLVRVRRGGTGGADSVNTAIVSAVATFIGPAGFKGVLLEAQGVGESEGF